MNENFKSNLIPLLDGSSMFRCCNCGNLVGYKAKDGTIYPYCWYCPKLWNEGELEMNTGKRQYLRYLSNRVSSSIDIITDIYAQTLATNVEGLSEEDRKIVLRALSDSIAPLGTIVKYIDRETKKKKAYKEITIYLKFNLDEEDESGNSDGFIRDDLMGEITGCANHYEIKDIDIKTKEAEE